MEIYNQYGMLTSDLQNQLSELEKKVFPIFLTKFPDATNVELRILFQEFKEILSVAMAEELLIRAMKMKKSTRELRTVRASKLRKAEDSVIFVPLDEVEDTPVTTIGESDGREV